MAKFMLDTPWVQYRQRKPDTRLRLFCFHYAGGSASIFRSFSAQLPSEIEVWPVQLPGRENRFSEPPFLCMEELIDPLQQALQPYLDTPYAFFGHSMGALISFELTRSLRRGKQIHEPLRLFVSGHRAPHVPKSKLPIHLLTETQFIEELRDFNGTSEEVLQHDELMRIFLPLLRADFALCETYAYTPEQPLNCPISAFGGSQDKSVSQESIKAWRDQTLGTFEYYVFDGDHFYLRKEQAALLAILSKKLLEDLSSI